VVLFVLLALTIANSPTALGHSEWDVTVRWLAGIVAALLLVASLLAHELAHSLLARHFGMMVRRITVFIFGGVSQLESEPTTALSELWMALVGPATSVVLGFAFLGAARALQLADLFPVARYVLFSVGRLNLLLAVFNMVPGFPLDGGRVLRAVIWRVTGNLDRSTRIAASVGQFVGMSLIALGILSLFDRSGHLGGIGGLWLAAIGWMLMSAAGESYQRLRVERALGSTVVRDVMSSPAVTIPAEATLQQAADQYFIPLRHASFPVVQAGVLRGMVSLATVGSVPRDQWPLRRVVEATEPFDRAKMTVRPDAGVIQAIMQMEAGRRSHLMVIDEGGRLVGIVSRSDIDALLHVKAGLGV
jgi:Zn-dependent protease